MAYLADAEVADFNELKAVLQATQGNLSVHLRKLEEAGYVAIDKSFLDRKPDAGAADGGGPGCLRRSSTPSPPRLRRAQTVSSSKIRAPEATWAR